MSGDTLILAGVLILRKLFKKKTTAISDDISLVKSDSSTTKTQQSSVVNATNELVEAYNNMKAAYDKYESVEDDRNRLVGAVMVQNVAILDILQSVYVNSKNLPQGTKDIVNIKYANAHKTLDNDQILKAIVESVRGQISTGSDET